MYTSGDQSLKNINNSTISYIKDKDNKIIKDSEGGLKSIGLADEFNGYYENTVSPDENKAPNMTVRTDNQYSNNDLIYELVRQLAYLNNKFDALVQIANNIQTLTNTVSSMNSTLSNISGDINALAYNQLGVRTSDCITNISEDTDNLSNIYNKLNAITASGESGEFLKCGTNY